MRGMGCTEARRFDGRRVGWIRVDIIRGRAAIGATPGVPSPGCPRSYRLQTSWAVPRRAARCRKAAVSRARVYVSALLGRSGRCPLPVVIDAV